MLHLLTRCINGTQMHCTLHATERWKESCLNSRGSGKEVKKKLNQQELNWLAAAICTFYHWKIAAFTSTSANRVRNNNNSTKSDKQLNGFLQLITHNWRITESLPFLCKCGRVNSYSFRFMHPASQGRSFENGEYDRQQPIRKKTNSKLKAM